MAKLQLIGNNINNFKKTKQLKDCFKKITNRIYDFVKRRIYAKF